ncbi:MAG: hypothetical protein KAI66_06685 [Lentisphaeria bacterium]|nr:hypothetical protein [Lentisphaeria bacterium]
MTFRAFAIGISCALGIAGWGYVNDWILDLERLNSGHLIPVVVVGGLLLLVLTLNRLLFRLKRSWALSAGELAVIFVLTSTACSVPGRSLMEHFPHVLVMPHHWYRVNPGWKDKKLIEYYPDGSLVDASAGDTVVTGFVTGLGDPDDRNLPAGERLQRKVKRVPWSAWRRPLAMWLPIVFLGALCYGCLALILHKQWSEHEHLAYPIAQFVTSILDRPSGSSLPPILRSRAFWIGLSFILTIRLNNGLHRWFPDYLIPVTLDFRFTPFLKLFPSITKVQWGSSLLRLNVFPLVIAFAFLLSTEISLTMGLSQILWVVFALPFITMGVNMTTDYGIGGWSGWQRGGSYTAFALMLAYTGRNYYLGLLRDAFTRWRRPSPETANVWVTRLLLVTGAALIALVVRVGLPLPFATLVVGLGLMSCVIVSRISAETGLFFIHPRWQPFGFLLAMFGSYMMNPSVLACSVMVCFMFSIDQSQAFLPYLANGLKVCEKLKVPRNAVSYTTLGVYVAGVILAVVIALVATYDHGTPAQCRWSYTFLPKMVFRTIEPEVLQLKETGLLADAERLPWHKKLTGIHAKPNFWWAAGFGFAAVLAFSFLRLRLPRWPLHPVLFLVWMTWPMVVFSYSFLLGSIVKKLTVRFGGHAMVQRLKPFMFGVIGGEILGAMVFMIAGLIYFLVTGKPPTSYRYFPR